MVSLKLLIERGHGEGPLLVVPTAGRHGGETSSLSVPGTDGGANYTCQPRSWALAEDRRAREATSGEPAGGRADAGH